MFTCLWHLWDWIETPVLFTQTMDNKKIPQPLPQKRGMQISAVPTDYRTLQSTLIQDQTGYQTVKSNIKMPGQHSDIHRIKPHQQQVDLTENLSNHSPIISNTYQQKIPGNLYSPEQLYKTQETFYQTPNSRPYYPNLNKTHPHPRMALQQQYQQIKQAKMQQQMQTQNETMAQQQRTFALRQQLNPPIPSNHYHMSSQSIVSLPNQLQNHRIIPPSSLNLSSQFQPAVHSNKTNNFDVQNQNYSRDFHSHQISQNQLSQMPAYQHNQQTMQSQLNHERKCGNLSPEQTPVYIQQNHPNHVVNQACQTQFSVTLGNKTKISPDTSLKSPSHQSIDRRKSSSSSQTIKSPVTKRPATAIVTMSGWLYKQGSDGLKVWRKRWFVLSEYCLYYYKGPEEEKILGSILLPSYRVAACSPEDKIYRKFAFKCEHTNMRVYWLAAENSESMGQWIRALSAATMMQGSSGDTEHMSQPSISPNNQSGNNSDSGIHTFQSQQSKLSISNAPTTSTSDNGSGGNQPLYANAPPKPRRFNDGGYSSPSPENSIEKHEHISETRRENISNNCNKEKDIRILPQKQGQNYRNYDIHPGNMHPAIPNNIYSAKMDDAAIKIQRLHLDNKLTQNDSQSLNRSIYNMPINVNYQKGLDANPNMISGLDVSQQIIKAPQCFNDDLRNDIYGRKDLYTQKSIQPMYSSQLGTNSTMNLMNSERRTPEAYGRSKFGQNKPITDYEDIYNIQQNNILQQNYMDLVGYQRPFSPPNYDYNKCGQTNPGQYTPNYLDHIASQPNLAYQANQHNLDNIARPHSADFLEYEARANLASTLRSNPSKTPRPKSSLDINRNLDSLYYSEASYAEKMRQTSVYLQKPNQYSLANNSTIKYRNEDNLYGDRSNTIGYDLHQNKSKHKDNLNRGNLSIPRMNRPILKDNRTQQNEQFLRSASARLPRKDDDATLRDGERKREESMKRLLEWKQRMLQSPLTRKGNQQNISSSIKLAQNSPINSSYEIQRSRSDTHANNGYNSYSSDDEDGPQCTPAGRSSPTLSSTKIDTNTNMIKDTTCNSANNINNLLLKTNLYKPVYNQSILEDRALVNDKESKNDIEVDKELKKNENDKDDEKENENNEIMTINYENSNDNKSIIQEANTEEDSDEEKENAYTDDDLIEALGEDIEQSENLQDINNEEQLYENDDTFKTTNIQNTENHYLPMTSKKSFLCEEGFLKITNDSEDNIEENPYVEMTKVIEYDTKSNYEIVDKIVEIKQEPVYMELSINDIDKNIINRNCQKKIDINKKKVRKYNTERIQKRKDLPDILKASEKNQLSSDSSDADDELSRDKNDTKLRSRTRFSLSDTFRPASYYLGTSTQLNNLIESSDSEIVSPPPIPLLPPPQIDDLKTEEIFSSENCNTIKRRNNNLNLSFDHISKLHNSNLSLNLNKNEILKSSRLSLPDNLPKIRQFKQNNLKSNENCLSDSNYSFQTDNSSNTSSDYDLFNKLKNINSKNIINSSSIQRYQNTDSESDSVDLRYRQINNNDIDLEKNRNRRPLSEESISEIESMSEIFEDTLTTTELDSYLDCLETSDVYLGTNCDNNWLNDGITNFIKPPEVFRNENDEHFYGNINFLSSNDSIQQIDKSNEEQLSNIKLLSIIKDKNDTDSENFKSARSTPIKVFSNDIIPIHSRNNSNISEQSAPYYYSDINNKIDIDEILNNQKDINLKRYGISHIYNPIKQDNINLTELNRSYSAEILITNDKDNIIDNKNLYKMTKINFDKNLSNDINFKMNKNGDSILYDSDSCTNLLTNELSKNKKLLINTYSSRKKRNIDTTINDNNSTNNSSKISELTAGEQLWEEDVLWRESLRRVSQRHARSLDDLDRINEGKQIIINDNQNLNKTQNKLTRDVMYVNDNTNRNTILNNNSNKNDKKLLKNIIEKDGNDVYVRLIDDSNDVYETLLENTNLSYSRKSIEIDREIIRQWDSMSSGLMKSTTGNGKKESTDDNNTRNPI